MPRITCPECKSTILLDQRTCPICGCILYWSRLLYRSALLLGLAGGCTVVYCFFVEGTFREGTTDSLLYDVLIGAAYVFGSAGLIVGCISLTGSAISHERFKRSKVSSGQHPVN